MDHVICANLLTLVSCTQYESLPSICMAAWRSCSRSLQEVVLPQHLLAQHSTLQQLHHIRSQYICRLKWHTGLQQVRAQSNADSETWAMTYSLRCFLRLKTAAVLAARCNNHMRIAAEPHMLLMGQFRDCRWVMTSRMLSLSSTVPACC